MAKNLIRSKADLIENKSKIIRARILVLCSEQEMEWMQNHPVYEKIPEELWFHTDQAWTNLQHKDFESIVGVGESGLACLLAIYKAKAIKSIIHLSLCSTKEIALFYIARQSGRDYLVEVPEEQLEDV